MRPEPLFGIGDLVIFNETRLFGNDRDRLFHIHDRRFGSCKGERSQQYWYAGFLLEIDDYGSEGLPRVPVFRTTIINVSESELRELEGLRVKFNIYQANDF